MTERELKLLTDNQNYEARIDDAIKFMSSRINWYMENGKKEIKLHNVLSMCNVVEMILRGEE